MGDGPMETSVLPECGAGLNATRCGGTDVLWHERPDFAQLTALWDMLPGGAVSSPFQTPEFLDCFFRGLAPGTCETFGVLAAHRPGAAEPCVLLPLIHYSKGSVRFASCPDLGVSDQNAPVLSRSQAGDGEAMVLAMCSDMMWGIKGADVVDVKKVHGTIGTTPNPLFHLPEAMDESATLFFDADALAAVGQGSKKKGVYKKAGASFRKLEKEGVRLVEVTSPAARLDILDAMMAMREERFRTLGRANSLKQDNREGFYRSLAGHSGSGNPIRILALKTDEELVAAVVMLAKDRFVNGILTSIGSERWQRFSPGMVMLVQSVYWARDNGIRIYNFGTGLQAYKSRFGAVEQPTRRLLVPLTIKGRAAVMAFNAKRRISDILRNLGEKSAP
ncbi:GNAT family N-acetyltransferase [Roseibium sediminicola]|uniref:GNAT family N-acetyltransferase n=1 Tax=Roseibium sediminicola TaxID=2933272 RepID=A0ABT0GME8_9HYPH|nr:GNAT family N-acetyltransferase [Roseibium sp. CAU 1639]MCK7610593.1 GNAT family N-acetyltransferase [Roseibium sp. CAU 1639]